MEIVYPTLDKASKDAIKNQVDPKELKAGAVKIRAAVIILMVGIVYIHIFLFNFFFFSFLCNYNYYISSDYVMSILEDTRNIVKAESKALARLLIWLCTTGLCLEKSQVLFLRENISVCFCHENHNHIVLNHGSRYRILVRIFEGFIRVWILSVKDTSMKHYGFSRIRILLVQDTSMQYWGSKSGIQCLFDPGIRDLE
jgi:hypothetical protein